MYTEDMEFGVYALHFGIVAAPIHFGLPHVLRPATLARLDGERVTPDNPFGYIHKHMWADGTWEMWGEPDTEENPSMSLHVVAATNHLEPGMISHYAQLVQTKVRRGRLLDYVFVTPRSDYSVKTDVWTFGSRGFTSDDLFHDRLETEVNR